MVKNAPELVLVFGNQLPLSSDERHFLNPPCCLWARQVYAAGDGCLYAAAE